MPSLPASAGADAWQEWLAEYNGRTALAEGDRVPETNFMARAMPGTVTGPFRKAEYTICGMDVWLHNCTAACPPEHAEHLGHMTDGRWHDACRYCVRRRSKHGTGLTADA
jgi:hypothetical protein